MLRKRITRDSQACTIKAAEAVCVASLLLALSTALSGCYKPQPPDLTGIWKSTEGGDSAVSLEFMEDGTYFRRAQEGGLTFRTAGTYAVGNEEIKFRLGYEQVEEMEKSKAEGLITVKYRIEGQALVLYPGTKKEQRFLLLR